LSVSEHNQLTQHRSPLHAPLHPQVRLESRGSQWVSDCQSGVWVPVSGGRQFGNFQIAYDGSCWIGNPLAGGVCGCPAGTNAFRSGEYYLNGFWSVKPDEQYQCLQ
ncbi:hypothetical protein, partial [Burkholderia cenocepacia]|uniref:hypothetical protein n=1 Tax=Burkholderia cenocepacia TaxID=95486 RepID=UPI001C407DE6